MDNSQVTSFACDKKFFDDKNYPRGFSRSGDFTRAQAQLLENKGIAMRALADGSRSPIDATEQRFVDVCQGQVDAMSDIERTWITYRKALQRRDTYFTASSAAASDTLIEINDSDD